MGKIACRFQRLFGEPGAPYLLTLSVWPEHAGQGGGHVLAGFPQNRAVVDDFGTLVCVGRWL